MCQPPPRPRCETPAARPGRRPRRGVVLVMAALLIVVVFAMAAMAIDVGYMMLMKTQLQSAADAGALAAGNSLQLSRGEVMAIATDYVTMHRAGGRNIKASETVVEIGVYDLDSRTFRAASGVGNAVRVTARRDGESLFFARVIGTQNFSTEASAISMANPKDIAFVIDLSGSMNDDTEPAWATSTINAEFGPRGFPGIGNELMQDVYDDFGYGAFPGTVQYLGAPVGVTRGSIAYAELTSDVGPLAAPSIPIRDRIIPGDSERTRRERSYRWIIENQLAHLLPRARPAPTVDNYNYWEKYIDYVLLSHLVTAPQPPRDDDDDDNDSGSSGGGSSGGGGPTGPIPPIGWLPSLPSGGRFALQPTVAGGLAIATQQRFGQALPLLLSGSVYGAGASGPGLPRVGGLNDTYAAWLPPGQDGDRLHQFNNPNLASFPNADGGLPWQLKNYFGYLTYLQFLMDHGRDLSPDGERLVELSYESGSCPLHTEIVAGRSFKFPPRTQPMHATRRSTIAAMEVAYERNRTIPSQAHRDQVAVVSFDTTSGSKIRQGLTADYVKAMRSVTTLQAVGDKATTTATESGLGIARELLRPKSEGGEAREKSTKIVLLLTDGIPNAYESSEGSLDSFARDDVTGDAYGGGFYWLDAALKGIDTLQTNKINVFPVGIGLGADYDFLDRAARFGGTAGEDGRSERGTGNPAEYEATLTAIFEKLISLPTARLVE